VSRSELRSRMGKLVTGAGDGRDAFASPPRTYEARVTLDLTVEDRRELKIAAIDEGVHMSDLLRALVALWHDDPTLRRKAAARARDETSPRRRKSA